MLKIKKLFLFYLFLLFSITFSLFLIQQATNHTIWWKKWTLRPKLPPGHLGWQLLKPLGSEATVNQHIPLATISYTTTITTISFTCYCLHSTTQPSQHSPMPLPHGCALVLILYFLIFYHSYVHTYHHSLMAVKKQCITASCSLIPYFILPSITPDLFTYSCSTALWLCRSSVAQPYSSAMAVQTQPHCCVLYLSPCS